MRKPGKKTILIRILLLVAAVTFIQAAVSYCLLVFRGTFYTLDDASATRLNSVTEWRTDNIESEMKNHWGSMKVFENQFLQSYTEFIKTNGLSRDEFNSNIQVQKQFIISISPELIKLLRQNKVNGVYLILNGGNEAFRPMFNQKRVKQGICIRDLDQNANYSGNDDLFVSRAPASILDELGLSLDSNWESAFEFTDETESDYYYKPLEAMKGKNRNRWEEAAYWSSLHRLSEMDINVISYSIPLLDYQGNLIGVAGIEISEDYLKKVFPYRELDASHNGEYILAVEEDGGDGYRIAAKTGFAYDAYLTEEGVFRFDEKQKDGCFKVKNVESGKKIYGSIHDIDLYEKNSAFKGEEQWYAIGLLNEKDLYDISNDVENALFVSMFAALVAALAGGIAIGGKLTEPIRVLAESLKSFRPGEKLELPRTDIEEIDGLVTEIEKLQIRVLENNRKLSDIFNLSGLPISAFEIDTKNKTVFFTDRFFSILDYKIKKEELGKLKEYSYFIQTFKMQDEAIISREQEGDKLIANYYFTGSNGKDKWVRVQAIRTEDKTIGILSDVSREFDEKIKLQHERDHDLLTNLYNRRAFYRIMKELFSGPREIKTGAMIMLDLDNLKYINDSYGHDAGDEYIKEAAKALEECVDRNMILARMSGDEFNIFLLYYDNRGAVKRKLKEIQEHVRTKLFHTVRESIPIRMTGGFSWYPEDAADYEDLMHLADFAMYQAKRTAKGDFREFDGKSYARDSFLLKNTGELNTIIEKGMVQYYFQPIVSLQDGLVFAYEALMRPMGNVIRRPDEMLALAKNQGRLYHVERLTWNKALQEFSQNKELMDSGCKVFVNSISNQVLSETDLQLIGETYGAVLNRVVMELTEEERLNNEYTETKRRFLEKWQAELALDDFGSGYNGENLLLLLNPNYIKADMNIIRNVDKDEKRQMVFNNLISYSRSRGIKVIAEGVETIEELLYVKEHGADLVQGYLLGKPEPNPGPIPEKIRKLLNGKG